MYALPSSCDDTAKTSKLFRIGKNRHILATTLEFRMLAAWKRQRNATSTSFSSERKGSSTAWACIPHRKNGGGVILNMASIAGSSALADRFAYSMSKVP